MKRYYRFLFILHAFVSVGALFGGLAGMLNPFEPLGIPAELLDGSPFSSYFVPSLILFVVIGLGNGFSALTAKRNSKYQGYISSVFSWALMIWIVVQVVIIDTVDFLHVLYFLIGLAGAAWGMLILYEQRMFPTNLFRKGRL